MTDFNNIIEKAKELEAKMKESQKKIKDIKVEGISGANSVKEFLNGEGEMIGVDISPSILNLAALRFIYSLFTSEITFYLQTYQIVYP